MSYADTNHLKKDFSLPFRKQLKQDLNPFDDIPMEDSNTNVTLKYRSFLSHYNDKMLSPWIQSQFTDQTDTPKIQKRGEKHRIFENIKNVGKLKQLDRIKNNVSELSKLSNTLLSFRNTISESKKKHNLKDHLEFEENETILKPRKKHNSLKVATSITRNLSLPIQQLRAKSPRIIFFERKIKLKEQLSNRQMMTFNLKNKLHLTQKYASKYHTIVINKGENFQKSARKNHLLCYGSTIQSWNKKINRSLRQQKSDEKQQKNLYFDRDQMFQ